jgi:hypothetical protein
MVRRLREETSRTARTHVLRDARTCGIYARNSGRVLMVRRLREETSRTARTHVLRDARACGIYARNQRTLLILTGMYAQR